MRCTAARTREHTHAQRDGQNEIAVVGLLQLQQVLLGADATRKLGRLLVGLGRQLVNGLCASVCASERERKDTQRVDGRKKREGRNGGMKGWRDGGGRGNSREKR